MQPLSKFSLLRLAVTSAMAFAALPAVAQFAAPSGTPARAGMAAPAPVPTPAAPNATTASASGTTTSPLIAPPTPGGLTVEEVAERAARTSNEARANAEERAGAEAAVGSAKAAFIPRLSGVARYTRLSPLDQPSLGTLVAVPPSVSPGPIPAGTQLLAVPLTFPVIEDQYVSQATLQLPISDYLYRLPKLHAAAKGNARSARLLEQATRVRVATDARIAYYNWARARMQTDVAQQALASAQAHLKDVTAASASGAASKADQLRVESQVAAAELLLTRARSGSLIAEERLRTLMHDDSGRRLEIGEDLREPAQLGDLQDATQRSVQALRDEAMTRRLEPRALLEGAKSARDQAGAQRAAGLPRIDAVGNAYYSRPNSRVFPQEDKFKGTWDASLQVSWSPTDVFGIEAGHSQTLARARQLEAERASLADGIEQEVTQARQALIDAEAAIQSAARGLAAAEESYRVRRALFQNGRATSVELTDAETERSRAQLEAIGTRIDQRIAQARLRHALGRDVASVD